MYEKTGSIVRQAGSGRLSEVTSQVKALVEQQMQKDDETTAHQLHQMLQSTVLRSPLEQFYVAEHNLDGLFMAVLIVN